MGFYLPGCTHLSCGLRVQASVLASVAQLVGVKSHKLEGCGFNSPIGTYA